MAATRRFKLRSSEVSRVFLEGFFSFKRIKEILGRKGIYSQEGCFGASCTWAIPDENKVYGGLSA